MAVPSTSQVYWHIGNLGNAVFRVYDPTLHKQVVLEAGIYNMIPTPKNGQVRQLGDAYYFKLKRGYNEAGVGARAYDVAIPTSRQATYAEASITERALYGDLKIDNRSVRRAAGNGSVLRNLIKEATDDLGEVMSKELARMVYGDGSGVIATAYDGSAASGTTTLRLDKTGGFKKSGALYVREEKIIDSYTPADVAEITTQRVSDLDFGAAYDSATLAGAETWTAGSEIYTDAVYASTLDTEWEGFGKMFDDGTDFSSYAGITVSGSSYWKPIIDDNDGVNRPFNPEVLEKLLNRQRIRAGKGIRRQFILSNIGQPSEYWKYMLPSFQVNVPGTGGPKYDIGVQDAQPFKGIPWKTDVNCPIGIIFIPDMANIFRFEMKPLGPPDIGLPANGWAWDNSNRTDAAETYKCLYGNFFCTRRNTQIVYKDLTESFWF